MRAGRNVAAIRAGGRERNSTGVVARTLIDTNILVCRHDGRFPRKQPIAAELLRESIASGSAGLPHQSMVEFVAATRRVGPEVRLLDAASAGPEAEELMAQFPILCPDDSVLRAALRGAAAHDLPWFDAHLRAYAEVHGIEELLSEDFQHGRMYGTVTVRNPFLAEALP